MKEQIALQKRLRTSKTYNPQHAAILSLMIAASDIRHTMESVFAHFNITPVQYNVLRILRGVYPEGHPRHEIIARLIDKAPDVTRLIDRLVNQGLVERKACEHDRRQSIAVITQQGLETLKEIEPRVLNFETKLIEHLTEDDCTALTALCAKIIQND